MVFFCYLFKYSILQWLSLSLFVVRNWNYDDETPCFVDRYHVFRSWAAQHTQDMLTVTRLVVPNKHLLGKELLFRWCFEAVQVLDLSSNLLNASFPRGLGGRSLHYHRTKSQAWFPQSFAEKLPSNVTVDISFNDQKAESVNPGSH